jgi:hypothetical protein
MDTWILTNHPDLADSTWHNPFDVPGDHVDNDGNG